MRDYRGVRRTKRGGCGHLVWSQMMAPAAEMEIFTADVPGWFLVMGASQRQQYRVPSLIPGPALAYGWLFAGRFQGSA